MSETEQFDGAKKVAAFLLSLERNQAGELLSHLGEDVVAEVIEAMESIDYQFDGDGMLKQVIQRVALMGAKRDGVKPATETELRKLMVAGLGEGAAEQVLGTIQRRRRMERPFVAIERAPASAIRRVLAKESPAAVAVVLAHLDPSLSASVLEEFEANAALDIVKRMATLVPPPFEILEMMAQDLTPRIRSEAAYPPPKSGTEKLQTIAEMLNGTSGEVEKSVLENLNEDNAEMVTEIREFMFTWEDIADIDRRAMQKILGTVETRTLSVALKACSAAVEENVMSNLSSRVRDMVAEERELAGAMPMSEVSIAREEIMRGVRAMIESGELQPAKGGDELVT